MKLKQAFTIIELLIAMALSSIVIVGLLQAYNNIMKYIKNVQEIQTANRKVCLLFNQMERDFMTAFIPPIIEKIKSEKEEKPEDKKKEDEKKTEPESKESKEKQEEKKLEQLKKYFIAQNNDTGLAKTLNEKRTYPFKNVSFINTNPLQFYSQKRTRLVRVMYELVLDKKRSKGENFCYNLYRKETNDLENFKVKEDEVGLTTKSKFTQIRKHLIADGIHEFFIQYYYQGKTKSKSGPDGSKINKKILDTWGDTKETSGIVPNKVSVYISLWDEQLSKNVSMQAIFPIISFSLIEEKTIDKTTTDASSTDKQQASVTSPQTQPEPAPGGAPVANPPVTPNEPIQTPPLTSMPTE